MDFPGFDDSLPRLPLGAEMIGKIVATGQPNRVRGAMLKDTVVTATHRFRRLRVTRH